MVASAASDEPAARRIEIDLARADRPVDRFFDLSIGADHPGTLIRADSQAQLETAVDELGFRYVRFHDIFHDDLGTVRVVDGRTVYDWAKIDRLYDELVAKDIRPLVELGFTPQAMATSAQTIFYWKGNTSHPVPSAWRSTSYTPRDPVHDSYVSAPYILTKLKRSRAGALTQPPPFN